MKLVHVVDSITEYVQNLQKDKPQTDSLNVFIRVRCSRNAQLRHCAQR